MTLWALLLIFFNDPCMQVASNQESPFKKLMAANRGEIAVRITRAGLELGLKTVRIHPNRNKEDRKLMPWSAHFKAGVNLTYPSQLQIQFLNLS